MPKMVMMPPQGGRTREWARRLAETCPEYEIALPESDGASSPYQTRSWHETVCSFAMEGETKCEAGSMLYA